ncbi:MAG: patatin-like phospholipase family protein [Chromatiales bacterium]
MKETNTSKVRNRIALVLQGGGALGAYQAGVYEALEEHGFAPDWVVGTSIGAINGAIIAGNAPNARLARLRDYWRTVSRADFLPVSYLSDRLRKIYSFWSAMQTMMAGWPGFFEPRLIDPIAEACSRLPPDAASFYDTSELRATLERLVDFQLIRQSPVRLTVGAVHVTSGELAEFDNASQIIGPEHIMASGALPPGFPAVRIDGELYWDGGVYSNTPLDVVLDDDARVDTLCFMVDLWNPRGREPCSISEVLTRSKDILYASRSRSHVESYCDVHNLRRAFQVAYKKLPLALKNDPEVSALEHRLRDLDHPNTTHVVRLVYPAREWELDSKDFNFSWTAIEERWEQGYRDAARALKLSAWLKPTPRHTRVVLHELSAEEQSGREVPKVKERDYAYAG